MQRIDTLTDYLATNRLQKEPPDLLVQLVWRYAQETILLGWELLVYYDYYIRGNSQGVS